MNDTDDPGVDRSRPYATLADGRSRVHTDDPETLRAARDEARDSLDTTIQAIEAKDDKAISTVRLNLVLIGIAITAASSLPSSLHYANWFTIVGFTLLFFSTFFGMWAYTYTDYTPGVTSDYIEELEQEHYTEAEWLRWMNQRYQEWIRTATRSDSLEATQLGRTHVLQIIGVALIILGAIAGLYGMDRASIAPSNPATNQTVDTTEQPNHPQRDYTTRSNDSASGSSLEPIGQPDVGPGHPQDSYGGTHKIAM